MSLRFARTVRALHLYHPELPGVPVIIAQLYRRLRQTFYSAVRPFYVSAPAPSGRRSHSNTRVQYIGEAIIRNLIRRSVPYLALHVDINGSIR